MPCLIMWTIQHAEAFVFQTAQRRRPGYPADAQEKCRRAQIAFVGFCQGFYLCVGIEHQGSELLVYALQPPAKLLDVLHPLKIADDNTTGIGKNIGHDRNAFLDQIFIRFWCCRAVGAFDDNFGANVFDVFFE